MKDDDFYSLVKGEEKKETPDFYSVVTSKQQAKSSIEKPSQQQPDNEKPTSNKQTKTPDFFGKVKDYFTENKFGEALNLQMKSGGFQGAPALEPKVAKKVATEVGTIAAVEAAFIPVYGAIAAVNYAPRVLNAIVGLTQAGVTGAATATTSKLVDEGELPSKQKLIENGLQWVAIDSILRGGHLALSGAKTAFDFGKAVNSIAKKEGVKSTDVLKKLWDTAKNKIKIKFGKTIETPEDITPADVDELVEITQQEEKRIIEPKKEKTEIEKSEYQRKPIPKTYEEKVNHLVGKIKDSQKFIKKLQLAINENKYLITQSANKTKEKGTLIQNLENKKEILKAEKKYILELKMDLKDLKEKKEESKVQVPLGSVQSTKFNKRPQAEKLKNKQPVMGKKQAVKRSKVIDVFRKAFNDPIRIGKFRSKVKGGKRLGLHFLWPKVTRLLHANDVESAAHEIGHNLHTTLYEGNAKTDSEQRHNINEALRPYLGELKPLALYEPYGMEGFAEFTRLYVTNPEVAKELAPKFYAKFEADLDASYPEMKNALLEAREYYGEYLEGTPESRIRAQTDYANDSSFLDNLRVIIEKNLSLDNLKTQFLDDVFPAKRLVAEAFGIPLSEVENLKDSRNLYRSLRVLKGAVGKGDVFVLHETFDPKTLQPIGKSLREILRQLPDDESYREFNDYLIARRSLEKIGQEIETGIHLGDALAVEEKLRPKYGKLAQELDNYNDSLLKYAVHSGLISSKQYQEIKKNNLLYTPFQRTMDKKSKQSESGSGNLQAKNPIKRMKGSTRNIIAPIESILKNTYAIIINSEKNLSGKVLANLAEMKNVGRFIERVPTPTKLKTKISKEELIKSTIKHMKDTGNTQFLMMGERNGKLTEVLPKELEDILPDLIMKFGATQYPAGERIISVYIDGKPIYYEANEEIYEMWTKGIAPYTAGLITKIARFPARTLRAGAILNPKFMMKNVVRDTWGGFLFTKYGKNVKDPVGLFIDTLYSPLANLSVAAKQSKLYVDWLKAGGGLGTMQSLDRDSIIKKLEEVREGLKPHQIIQWLRKIASISEESNRLAEFGRALEVEGNTRLGMEIAAFASRDLSIDFAKMGLMMKAWNQVIPFLNATLQGTDKLVRTLTSDKDRAEFLLRGVAFIVIPALIFAWLNQDDENVQEFQEQEKDFNFITKVGGEYLKIPVPFETGVILNGLTQRMYNYFMKKDPEAFKGFMGSVMSAMLPNFIPSMANPLIETWANKNFFTGGRIIPLSREKLIAKYQYKDNTSSTARLIGRGIAYMVGQETRSKAASPAVIEHFIRSWTAGLGKLVLSITDEALELSGLSDKVEGPARTVTEKLELDAFTTRFPRAYTKSIEEFYDHYQEVTARQKSIKVAEKEELESDEAVLKSKERLDKIYDYKTLQQAYKVMQRSQKAINNIVKNPDLSAEDKRKFVDELYLQQIEFARSVNKDIKKYRLTKK